MVMAPAEAQFHVLAVDDSLIDRKLIERLLKTSSYQVTTVDSGSKALEILGLHEDDPTNPNQPSVSLNNHQEVQVNLVITDYCMPGMTGYDLLKKIKESSSLRNIPVVIMSSENVPSRISRCLEEGAEEFFLKPVSLSDVIKLRPHMMRTKVGNQERYEKQGEQEMLESTTATTSSAETTTSSSSSEKSDFESQPQQLQQTQTQTQTQPNSTKRKSVEEGLSPERTRPRYNGLTVMSN